MIAKATADSAASIMITKSAKTSPLKFMPPKREKARKFKLAEFKMSSTPIRTATAFLRVITANNPREKSVAEMSR